MAAEEATNFTSFKLAHSTPAHLHTTSVSKFIGPIPHGWVTAHKKRWSLTRTNYHKRHLSFSAEEGCANVRDAAGGRWRAEACVAQALTSGENQESRVPTVITNLGDRHRAQEDSENDFDDPTGLRRNLSAEEYTLRGVPIAIPPVQEFVEASDSCPQNPRSRSRTTSEITIRRAELPSNLTPTVRPSMNMTSPTGGVSTREASNISNASYATAPETLEEQAALDFNLEEGLSDEDDLQARNDEEAIESSDGESDTSTIRLAVPPELSDHQLAERLIPQQIGTRFSRGPLTYSDPSSADRSPASSDANSRKSLMNHNNTDESTPLKRSVTGFLPISNLVRFSEPTNTQTVEGGPRKTPSVCAEGHDIDRKVCSKAQRKNQVYFNQRMLRNPFRKVSVPGELLRAERMLVQVEASRRGAVPDEYCETVASRVDRRTERHWREFIVAARRNQDGHVVVTFHRNRTVPAVAKNITTAKASEKFVLNPIHTKANLYSALDKTIVVWQKGKKRTQIYILRPKTAHSSIAWYAFIQTSLGILPRGSATVNVPNLNVKLSLELTRLRSSRSEYNNMQSDEAISISPKSSSSDNDADSQTSVDINELGQVVASGVALTHEYLIDTCWRMLSHNKEWSAVLKDWKANERMGLCWRRYDRIEWLHGPSSRQLIGAWAMQASHELEFRPKEHYATEVRLPSGLILTEPAPVEGFLVRLTSSSGRQARFGKVFYKRLYFSSHDALFFYSSPGNARPPPPPNLNNTDSDEIEEAVSASPLVFDVDPYPLVDGRIGWLNPNVPAEEAAARNCLAMAEAKRRVEQLHDSDGYIDLTHIIKIRRCRTTQSDIDNNIGHDGDGAPFHEIGSEEETVLAQEEGLMNSFDDERVFELVLQSGLVVRLQCFNGQTRQVWMEHLASLVRYWKWRHKADAVHYKKLRQANLEALSIDEEIEGLVGQYASKWEVSPCVSEPQIYNFCPIASCRTIALRGLLYRKPRVHSTFRKYECVVSHGKLFVYNHLHWDAAGNQQHHIHHSRKQVIDLSECYVYSGNVTQNDLIGARETSDREGPGRHSLPRRYNDGWTSQDEQETMCFVIWTGRRRVALRGVDKLDSSKDNSVSRLGVPGYSMIYMARCRQERDLWVQILSNEIERSSDWGTT